MLATTARTEAPAPSQTALLECLSQHAAHLGSLVHNIAKKLAVTPEDAEEAAQEAFLAALQAIRNGTAGSITNRQGWLVRAGRNKCVDARRTAKKHAHSRILPDAAVIDASCQDDSPLEQAESIALVRAAVSSLRGIDRRLIVYCNLWGHTPAEACRRFHLSAAAVGSRLFRARSALREKLREHSQDK